MFKKVLILLCIFCFSAQLCLAATSASQTVTATLTRSGGGGGGGGGGIPGGAVVGIAGGGAAAAGASALAFAPLLLAGLEPNTVVCAAAPLECITQKCNYLQEAIKLQCGLKCNRFYVAKNDGEILNGTYDVDEIRIPEELKSANRIKINVTIVSQPYNSIAGEPDLRFDIYKNINHYNLSKKFETQQFLHHYLMHRYEIPLRTTYRNYSQGIQKLSGIIDLSKLEYADQPLHSVVRYTEGGFRINLRRTNPKTLVYAYLIEFEK